MLHSVRVELSGYGFGALFEVRFQNGALPLICDTVRYTLLSESSKPVGTDPVHFHLDETRSCPHLNDEQRLPESWHCKQCAEVPVASTYWIEPPIGEFVLSLAEPPVIPTDLIEQTETSTRVTKGVPTIQPVICSTDLTVTCTGFTSVARMHAD